jgi:chlorobactene glucosyltransferase
MTFVTPLGWALPWVVPLAVALWRASYSRSLDDMSDAVAGDMPLVSVIIPARNERRNIERCVRSVLASRYPSFDVIVVDDHSTDGTGEIARAIAAEDARVRVIDAPPLAEGWFGKQWACAAGARVANGTLLIFTDADTWHAPDLMPRAVNALRDRAADLLSVAGHQEMHSFWERVIQPQMFGLLASRYGGTEHVSQARRPEDVIANGQFILVRRDAYEAMRGHEAVRDRVAEDLSLAQNWVRAGRPIALLFAERQLSTHMYASLSELIGGWRKNIYAGGRNAMVGGAPAQAAYPVVLLGLPLYSLAPVIALLLSLVGVLGTSWLVWGGVVYAANLVFWAVIYRFMRQRIWYALLYPLGIAMLFYIAAGAVLRGSRVEWKNRQYVTK